MKTLDKRLVDAVLALEPIQIHDSHGNRTDWIECPTCNELGRLQPGIDHDRDPDLDDIVHDYDCPYRLASIARRAAALEEKT